MIRAAALILALLIAGCESPALTGIAAGLQESTEAPRRPLTDPHLATFAFLPFEGVPGNLGDDLLRRLWSRMDSEGLQVVKRPDGRALFTVEGTLTAVTDDNTSLVFTCSTFKMSPARASTASPASNARTGRTTPPGRIFLIAISTSSPAEQRR